MSGRAFVGIEFKMFLQHDLSRYEAEEYERAQVIVQVEEREREREREREEIFFLRNCVQRNKTKIQIQNNNHKRQNSN